MPKKLAIAVFDWNVDSGRSVMTLQEVLGQKQPDGIWGSKTKNDTDYYLKKHGEAKLVAAYNGRREGLYYLYASKGNQKVFLQGWFNRLTALNKHLGVA